ncbi:pyrroline-5-carboxylate reductase [SAR86 cluster bacterium]|jgi:pyrroline-5-carboxylate reductase|nr:pyrroline-5-carboxylate reductase [SAR86 cluster bacterium]
MNNIKETIGFIGAGNMATALISGLINSDQSASKIIASSPEQEHLEKLSKDFGIKTTNNNLEIVDNSDIVILAVKPNIVQAVIDEIKDVATDKDILIISIAAGVKIEKIESQLGSPMRVIRAMPNTPASIMEGVTAICANSNAQSNDIENAKLLFECVGKITHINEKDIDIFTALIGSGPAYIFYLIESLLDSSKNLHLPEQEKKDLLASMISGAANLVLNSDESPNVLRKKVTSPGGVTQTAIEEFETEGLKEILSKSMIAAEKKSIELGED